LESIVALASLLHLVEENWTVPRERPVLLACTEHMHTDPMVLVLFGTMKGGERVSRGLLFCLLLVLSFVFLLLAVTLLLVPMMMVVQRLLATLFYKRGN
jgi:hypothetical protein